MKGVSMMSQEVEAQYKNLYGELGLIIFKIVKK